MTVSREIASMVPVRDIVRQAIMDTYGDFVNEEQRFTAWTIRGVKKLVRQTLRSGKRYVILNVNKNLRTAILPCDFEEELAVFVVNKRKWHRPRRGLPLTFLTLPYALGAVLA